MSHFYSPSSKGFYDSSIHASIPDDAFVISDDLYVSLLEGQSRGKIITYEERKLKLVDYVAEPVSWNTIRNRRNMRLSACDWTQLPDAQLSPSDRIRWADYRQELRDITNLFEQASDVVWPLSPDQTSAGDKS